MRTVKRELWVGGEYHLVNVPSEAKVRCPHTKDVCISTCAAFQYKPPEHLPNTGLATYYCQAMGGCMIGEEARKVVKSLCDKCVEANRGEPCIHSQGMEACNYYNPVLMWVDEKAPEPVADNRGSVCDSCEKGNNGTGTCAAWNRTLQGCTGHVQKAVPAIVDEQGDKAGERLNYCDDCNRSDEKYDEWCQEHCFDHENKCSTHEHWQPANVPVEEEVDDDRGKVIRVPKGMLAVFHDINNILQKAEMGDEARSLLHIAKVMHKYNATVTKAGHTLVDQMQATIREAREGKSG